MVDISENGSLTSKHFNFRYILGKIYKTKFLFKLSVNNNTDKGFHSYGKKPIIKKSGYVFTKKYNGKSIDLDIFFHEPVIIKCIIPKGTKYCFNGTDYISEAIKPVCIIYDDKFSDPDVIKIIKKYYTNIKTIK